MRSTAASSEDAGQRDLLARIAVLANYAARNENFVLVSMDSHAAFKPTASTRLSSAVTTAR
jgi:hypothetical protein